MQRHSTQSQADRQCQPCHLCCIATSVESLDKPCGVACEHLRPCGCGIYAQRRSQPRYDICISFECLWKRGWFEAGDRPDLLGVIFSEQPDPDRPGESRLQVIESCPGAAHTTRTMEIIQSFLRQGKNVGVANPEYLIGFRPNGDSWHFVVDPTDPLHSRADPSQRPTQLTAGGRPLLGPAIDVDNSG